MPDLQIKNCLSSGDALFLYFEREGQPVNVASVAVFEGAIPLELCTEHIESKLPLIPRYRQRVTFPPFHMDLPMWEYDPKFDIRNHVRELALKRGTESEFKTVVSKILSTALNRDRPLWELILMRGLKENRTGAILRMHHCLADGISGVGVLNVLFDSSPFFTPPPKDKPPCPPLPAGLGTASRDGLITSSISAIQRVLTASSELLEVAKQVVAAVENPPAKEATPDQAGAEKKGCLPLLEEVKRMLPEAITLADRLPFNVVCRGPQKFGWAEIPLAEIKAVKQACEVSVNDVVLAAVTGAIRRYAARHRVRLKGRQLRIVVPVNVRGDGGASDLGNRITFLPISVPLDINKPRELIAAAHEAVEHGRKARLGEMVGLLGTLLGTIPTALQSVLGPLVSQLPLNLCNLICTNVPGPQAPLYLCGHKLLSSYPYVPIGGEMGMNCAILTYNGTAYFGFTGDAQAIPDLEQLEKFLRLSFASLRKAAGVGSPRPKVSPPKAQPLSSPTAVVPRETVADLKAMGA